MRKIILALLVFFSINASFAEDKAIVKANILRGGSFVTANTNPEDIENVITQALAKKGIQTINEVIPNEQIFYIDLFVFQFPADYPTITITIRTNEGIHFIDKESIKLFTDRNSANIKLASRLADRLPDVVDTRIFYKPTLNEILSNTRLSLIGSASNEIAKTYRSNYSNSIKWPNDVVHSFIIPDEFDNYMVYALNFPGNRKQLKETPIKLKVKINPSTAFELVEIVSPFNLTEKQKGSIQELVDSFPLWAGSNQIDNIEIEFSVK
ncbi:hypothetical protein J0A68_16745 [Algoriphagus sp. H41]|uniref:DUF4384 domain-containing protein n=1 Tax=Algoriphagus oliviformis TaxID=2811231 RepID=A0ABS3C8W9_9BACT|nr:hypothetical protein [Algoriphagus oliviformis]MBN7812605.1 hypothetical protein [Algoriphagus oliviformis]